MSRMQREKGKVAEREVVHALREHGFTDARRQGDAGQIDGDVGPVPGAYFEVRRREELRIKAWANEVEQEARDLGKGQIPVLAFRTNGEPWRAVVPLDDLLRLLAGQT